MFTGVVDLCKRENFKFEDFYNAIHEFKQNTGLTLINLSGRDTELVYKFKLMESKTDITIKFDYHYEHLTIELEIPSSTLDTFTILYMELVKAIESVMHNKE